MRGQHPSWGGCLFLSTLSLRRATKIPYQRQIDQKNFYPRSPCGERPDGLFFFGGRNKISIHALLAESDCTGYFRFSRMDIISIHALLAESDCGCCARCRCWAYFYPRSPCGERRFAKITSVSRGLFLSTLSLRRATYNATNRTWLLNISIHALLAESDSPK